MPNSSRRKQSKPQHVLNEEEESNKAGKNTDTSNTTTTGNQPTQERQYGSNVTGHSSWENGNTGDEHSTFTVKAPIDDDDMDESGSEGHESLDKNNIEESLPHDLSMKSRTKLEKSDIIDDIREREDDKDREGLAPIYTPPSEHLVERFCVYCNEVRASAADLDQHLREHTQDRPYHCQGCNKLFKSKRSLLHHEFMEHGAEPPDSNIAQHELLLRKRRLDETQLRRDLNHSYTPEPSDIHHAVDSPTNLSVSPSTSEMASKRQRMSESYHNAMSEMGLDLKMSRSNDVTLKTISSDSCDSQDLMKACVICSKTFPKPSDLKRHMMCHTGEKPFRCEHCHKPFRAKSSMHYHLKATHGIDIELSPGLEERYLRMKARAHMNVTSRSLYSQQSYPFKDNLDIDEIEDDTKSTDSMYFQGSGSGLGSDFKEPHSQGHYSQTGNENRGAMDLSMSDKHNQHTEKDYNTTNNPDTEVVFTSDAPFRKSKISIQNETVVITRLDGFNVTNGENASLFKCYLCGRMFQSLSSMQCHLSLHFEKQIISYECCFCNEVFQFKTQMRNHIQRKHNHQVNGRNRRKGGQNDDTKDVSDNTSDKRNPSHKTKNTLYRCRYCRKRFISKISLNKHLKLHFWNRNCFCRICGKSFQHYTSLQLHISRFHWKTGRQPNKSWMQGKLNFFNTKRFHIDSHDGVRRPDNREPLDLMKSKTYQNERSLSLLNAVTVVMPQSPRTENGDLSDTGASHHSSENNWSESPSDLTVTEYDETGAEIKAAPKRSLMSFRRENSPRSKTSRKSTPAHLPPQNHSTSDNALPLNFIKTENAHQDSNNNESSAQESTGHISPDPKPAHIHESLLPGYALNATNHLLMAKALAAQQSLAQHLNSNSSSLIYPPNHLPPSLAAMSQMMSLPMSVQVPPSGMEGRAGTSKSPSPASHSSSKSDTSPEDRDIKEPGRDSLVGYPRVQWGQHKGPDWTFNLYCPTDSGHTDGRKVTSLSRTHSRLGIVHAPINRESMCKPTTLSDGRTVYKCPFCSKEFVSFSDINRHMDFHEDIRPYKCQFCDYYARTNSQLKVHMMRHQGIREFCCKLCNYKGVTQSDLNRHMKSQIHMLKSRNACSYCGEGFVTPKNLEKHLDGNCIVKMQKMNGGLDIRLQESVA